MKKFLASIMMLMLVAVALPMTTLAHNNCRKHYRTSSARYANTYYGQNERRYRSRSYHNRRSYARGYNTQPTYYSSYPAYGTYYGERRPSFYRRHRNAVNLAIGTGGGAVLGGLLGGKKGAAIGALLGAGGSALYTYKLNPKQRRYYR